MIDEKNFMFELEHIGLGMSCIEACCKSICREFGLEYISFEKSGETLQIWCKRGDGICSLRELVKPYGFRIYDMEWLPTPQYVLEYDFEEIFMGY